MKILHPSKEYFLKSIKNLSKDRNHLKYIIQKCDILIEKERVKLNNTNLSHDTLWLLRDERAKAIKHLRETENELKLYNKYLTKYFYTPILKTNVIFNYTIEITK